MPMPKLRGSYQELRADCRKFLERHPDYDRNVFIMTRFVPGDALLAALDEELRHELARRGLHGVRADDRMIPVDRQLWKNVCVYMLCCATGVAVLEDRLKDEFNPNVALEYGFMRALDKPVLLLKDKGFRNARADILGTVHGEFDIVHPAATLPSVIEQWAKELDLALEPGTSRLEQLAFGVYRNLLMVEAARQLRDDGRRRRELDDELHYLGEKVWAYEQALAALDAPEDAKAIAETRARIVMPDTRNLDALPRLTEKFRALARRPG